MNPPILDYRGHVNLKFTTKFQKQVGTNRKNQYVGIKAHSCQMRVSWITMACHVYDLVYYKVMSIDIYNM
jgi:hypothetical protein